MNVLSLGAGVQSSTVLLMSCRGVLPKLDAAIFADTQWEPKAVYEWLENVLEPEAKHAGIPLYRVTAGDIRADAVRSKVRGTKAEGARWASMPFYTHLKDKDGEGMIRRQCTKEYKIEPVQKKLRELRDAMISADPSAAYTMHDERARVRLWMGISGDEKRRMRMSKVYWIEHAYPLVFEFDRPWHRRDCLKWLYDNAFPEAPRSACIGCPYRSNEEWRSLNREEWADAVLFDEQIRKVGGLTADTYIHRSCKPLNMIDLSTAEERGQGNWINECEGMCGV